MNDKRINLMYALTKSTMFYDELMAGYYRIKTPFPYSTIVEIDIDGNYKVTIERVEAAMNSYYKVIPLVNTTTSSVAEVIALISKNVEY